MWTYDTVDTSGYLLMIIDFKISTIRLQPFMLVSCNQLDLEFCCGIKNYHYFFFFSDKLIWRKIRTIRLATSANKVVQTIFVTYCSHNRISFVLFYMIAFAYILFPGGNGYSLIGTFHFPSCNLFACLTLPQKES